MYTCALYMHLCRWCKVVCTLVHCMCIGAGGARLYVHLCIVYAPVPVVRGCMCTCAGGAWLYVLLSIVCTPVQEVQGCMYIVHLCIVSTPVQVVQGDLLIGVHILSKEVDVITLKVVLLISYCDTLSDPSGGSSYLGHYKKSVIN